MACQEANPSAIIRSVDDGNRVLIIKGGANKQGNFMRMSEVSRSGRGHSVILPRGANSSSWANVAYILRWSFRGALVDVPEPCPATTSMSVFPPLLAPLGEVCAPNKVLPIAIKREKG